MKFGYARVSTEDQSTDPQVLKLEEAGAERIFTETASGGRWDRPELHRMMEQLRPTDVVVVTKLDRLSRSLLDLLRIVKQIDDAGAGFVSLSEAIDTTTPAGRMLMQMVGSFAEFEREMIRERTKAGLTAAKKQGRLGGRPRKLSAKQVAAAQKMITQGESMADIARLFGVHPSTISRLAGSLPHGSS